MKRWLEERNEQRRQWNFLGLTSEDAAGAAAATAGDTAAERAKADGKSPEEVAAAACPHFTDTQNVTLVSPSVTADTSLLATTTEHSPAQFDNIPTVLRAQAVFCITSHNLNHASHLAREAGASHCTTSTMLPTLLEKPDFGEFPR